MNTNEAKSLQKLFETVYENACKEADKLQENKQMETINDSSLFEAIYEQAIEKTKTSRE